MREYSHSDFDRVIAPDMHQNQPDKDILQSKIAVEYNLDFQKPAYDVKVEDYDLQSANNIVIEKFGNSLLEYLKLPIIKYRDIADHEARRNIRSTIENKYGAAANQILQNDKMKSNKISAIEGFIQVLGMTYLQSGLSEEIKHKITDAIVLFPTREEIQNYGFMSDEAKTDLVKKMDVAALNFLSIFKRNSTESLSQQN